MTDDSGRPAAALPEMTRAGLVAGIGLRAGASADQLLALLDASLAAADASRNDLVALSTHEARAHHPALVASAAALGIPVLALAPQSLCQPAPNPSQRVARLIGVPSVAEAAALAFGPLVLAKRRTANLTCALSRYAPVDAFGRSSASSAVSTLATSSAGP